MNAQLAGDWQFCEYGHLPVQWDRNQKWECPLCSLPVNDWPGESMDDAESLDEALKHLDNLRGKLNELLRLACPLDSASCKRRHGKAGKLHEIIRECRDITEQAR